MTVAEKTSTRTGACSVRNFNHNLVNHDGILETLTKTGGQLGLRSLQIEWDL